LSNAASSVGKAIETASIAELQSQLGKLGKQEHKAVWELDNGCVSEATRIAASISQMRTEDAAYHRSVAEAQAKAAAVARAQAQAQALAQAEAQAKAAMGKWQSR
jgi:membrane protein involved in colicin uptake